MKSLKLKSGAPCVELGFGLSFTSFLLGGLLGKEDSNGSEAGGNSCDGVGMGFAQSSLLFLVPMSVPMLDILDVKLFSPPLANNGNCLGEDPLEAGGSPGPEGNRTRPLSRNAPEPPLRAR
jgi:hypothetical protein